MKTLADIIGQLSRKDRIILCISLNRIGYKEYQMHEGLLPWVPVDDAIKAVEMAYMVDSGLTKDLLQRLKVYQNPNTFLMYLADKKVLKRCGPHPELGVKLPGHKMMAEAGVKWHQFAKKYKPNPISVDVMFSLRKIARGCWLVSAKPEHKSRVQNYLLDHCAV